MTNCTSGNQRDIKGQKYNITLGTFVSDDGSKPEAVSRIEQAALTKLSQYGTMKNKHLLDKR